MKENKNSSNYIADDGAWVERPLISKRPDQSVSFDVSSLLIYQISTEDYEGVLKGVLPIWTEGQKKGRAGAVW